MMQSFQDLGSLIAARWIECGSRIEAFTEVATCALRESDVFTTVDIKAIADWLATSNKVPQQRARDFGQPQIDVYVGEGFCVQVLFWLQGTTAIHEHSFAGAFGVLEGSSLHSQYRFELQREFSKEFLLGNVRFVSSELLRKGDVRPIAVGSSYIHALFHLDHPSISIVVRTTLPLPVIQYSYIRPHVAYDPFHEDKTLKTQVRLLESLRSLRSELFWRYAEFLIDHNRPLMLFNVLGNAYQFSGSQPSNWEQLADKARQRHGSELVDSLIASVKTEDAGTKLWRLRSVVHSPDYRFFLALLLNVPDRDSLLALVAQRFNSEEPALLMMKWIREMSRAGLYLSRLDPEMLNTIELVLHHKSFEEARAALMHANNPMLALADEAKMRKLWQDAHSILFSTAPEMTAAGAEA
jgi:hypothetical protein